MQEWSVIIAYGENLSIQVFVEVKVDRQANQEWGCEFRAKGPIFLGEADEPVLSGVIEWAHKTRCNDGIRFDRLAAI